MKQILSFLFFITFSAFGKNEGTIPTEEINHIVANPKYNKERILNFNADINVHKDASLTVTETIFVNTKGDKINTGLYRSLPLYTDINNQHYKTNYTIISVKRDGKNENYHTEKKGNWLKVYMGSKDNYVVPGQYTYEIKYNVDQQVGFTTEYDELQWNVTGTEFDFRIDTVTATVHLPQGADIINNACSTGIFASIETNCSFTKIDNNTMVWHTNHLHPKEGLSLSVTFTNNVITAPPPRHFLEKYGVILFLAIAFLAITYLCYKLWMRYRKTSFRANDNLQYIPPARLTHSNVDYFSSGNNNVFTEIITGLAIKKYIFIEEVTQQKKCNTSTTFKLTKLKDSRTALSIEESAIMKDLFLHSKSITITATYKPDNKQVDMDYNTTIKNDYNPLLEVSQKRNLYYLATPTILYLITFIAAFVLANVINGRTESINFGAMIALFIVIPYMLFSILQEKKETTMLRGLKVICSICLLFGVITIFILFVISLHSSMSNMNTAACSLFFISSFIVLLIMLIMIQKPTIANLSIHPKKVYFNTYEEDTEDSQSMAETVPPTFEKHFPYAIAFGIEDIWGQKSSTLLPQAMQTNIPTWNTGADFSVAHFQPVLYSRNMNTLYQSKSRATIISNDYPETNEPNNEYINIDYPSNTI